MKSLIICALGSLFFGCHHQPKEASVPPAITNTQAADTMWKKEFEQLLPKLGHRNWILVVDKAFPLQSAPGIVTINTGEPMRPVLGELVRMLEKASHVKPVYYTDLELNSLSDDLCPGAGTGPYRDFPGPAGRPGQHDPARRGFLEDRHGIETLYHRGTENRINHSLFVGIHRTGLRVLERCRRKSIADKNEIAPETVSRESGGVQFKPYFRTLPSSSVRQE